MIEHKTSIGRICPEPIIVVIIPEPQRNVEIKYDLLSKLGNGLFYQFSNVYFMNQVKRLCQSHYDPLCLRAISFFKYYINKVETNIFIRQHFILTFCVLTLQTCADLLLQNL